MIAFIVSYHDRYEKIQPKDEDLSHRETSDFEKVLPYDEIQSSHLFDLAAYVSFQQNQQDDITIGE